MINVKELFEKGKLRFLMNQKDKKKIIEYLLKCPNIKEALNYLDTKYLHNLDLDFYEIPVEGYMNLYDYIINTRNEKIELKPATFLSSSIYIPNILKYKSLMGINPLIITTDMVLDKLPSGETIIEYVLENDKNIDKQKPFVVDKKILADILYKNKKIHLLKKASPEILMYKIDNDKTVLDILKENNMVPQCKYIAEEKKGNSTPEFEVLHNIALEKVGDKTLLETLIDEGFKFNVQIFENFNTKEEWEKVVNILFERQELKKIKSASEFFLTTKINHKGQETKILDLFKDEELPELSTEAKDEYLLVRYINARRYNTIMFYMTEETLFKEVSPGVTVLDYLILKSKSNATLYHALKALESRNLLTPKVTLRLAKYELYIKSQYERTIGIKSDSDLNFYIYKEEEYELDKEGEKYIALFKKAYNDHKSSKEVIDTAIKSFKRTYSKDKVLAIRDIKALIGIKKEYPNFTLQYDQALGGCFSSPVGFLGFTNDEPKLNVDNKYNLETFNHELGHLVHFYYDNEETPEEIDEILKEAYLLPEGGCASLFEELNKEATELLATDEEYEKEFFKFINEKYGNIENYHNVIRNDFKKLIGSKDLVLEAINDGSYSKEVLKALVDLYYEQESEIDKDTLVEQYVENRVKAEKQIFKNEMYRKDNVEFLCYENFIDAVFMGEIYEYTTTLTKEEREKIKAPMCTHNMQYFVWGNKQFAEIYANYMELKKSPRGEMYIERLKQKTSPRLIELVEEYNKKLEEKLENTKSGKSI